MDLIAQEVMRRSVQTVAPEMTLFELERALVQADVSGFPVVEADQLVGVVSRSDLVRQLYFENDTVEHVSDFYRDSSGFHVLPPESDAQLAQRVGERLQALTVRDVMHSELFTVPPDQTLRAIAQTMADKSIHRVLVTHDGKLLGLITATDFVRLYASGRLKAN